MKERYQLRQAAGAYWLLDMEQGEQYKKPFMLNECGAYIYRAYISGMSEDEIMQAFAKEYGLSFSCAQIDFLFDNTAMALAELYFQWKDNGKLDYDHEEAICDVL